MLNNDRLLSMLFFHSFLFLTDVPLLFLFNTVFLLWTLFAKLSHSLTLLPNLSPVVYSRVIFISSQSLAGQNCRWIWTLSMFENRPGSDQIVLSHSILAISKQ